MADCILLYKIELISYICFVVLTTYRSGKPLYSSLSCFFFFFFWGKASPNISREQGLQERVRLRGLLIYQPLVVRKWQPNKIKTPNLSILCILQNRFIYPNCSLNNSRSDFLQIRTSSCKIELTDCLSQAILAFIESLIPWTIQYLPENKVSLELEMRFKN